MGIGHIRFARPRTPELMGNLRAHSARLPKAAQEAKWHTRAGPDHPLNVYTADLTIIRNCDADFLGR